MVVLDTTIVNEALPQMAGNLGATQEEIGWVSTDYILANLGPTLGGWITDNYTWSWCFFINVPIGIDSAFLVTGFLRDPPDQTAHTADVDWTGIALLTVGIGSLQYVLEEGNAKAWFEDGRILRLAVLAALAPGAMLWWELRGFGLGLLFVPINAVAYSSIKPSEAQQASGQINLSRQLGGAFGIAVLANRVAKRAQFHRIALIGALSPGSPLTDELMRLLTGGFLARGMDPDRAHQAALSLLNAQVQQQATLLSFNDAWMFVLVAFALVSPSILILRKPGRGVAPTADAH